MSAPAKIDPRRTALVIQGIQNDVMEPEGKLYAEPQQEMLARGNVVANIARIADRLRQGGGVVAHLPFIVHPGSVGVPRTAPVFRRFAASGALIRGSWGAAPWAGLPVADTDFVIEKMRVNPFHGSTLLPLLRSLDISTVIPVGTQTNMGIVAAARFAADEAFQIVAVTDACAANDAAAHQATFDHALCNVAQVMDTAELVGRLN